MAFLHIKVLISFPLFMLTWCIFLHHSNSSFSVSSCFGVWILFSYSFSQILGFYWRFCSIFIYYEYWYNWIYLYILFCVFYLEKNFQHFSINPSSLPVHFLDCLSVLFFCPFCFWYLLGRQTFASVILKVTPAGFTGIFNKV